MHFYKNITSEHNQRALLHMQGAQRSNIYICIYVTHVKKESYAIVEGSIAASTRPIDSSGHLRRGRVARRQGGEHGAVRLPTQEKPLWGTRNDEQWNLTRNFERNLVLLRHGVLEQHLPCYLLVFSFLVSRARRRNRTRRKKKRPKTPLQLVQRRCGTRP